MHLVTYLAWTFLATFNYSSTCFTPSIFLAASHTFPVDSGPQTLIGAEEEHYTLRWELSTPAIITTLLLARFGEICGQRFLFECRTLNRETQVSLLFRPKKYSGQADTPLG
jgi:hypothetical protein